MTIHTPKIKPTSGITECPICEGHGTHWNGRGEGGNNPDRWDVDCSNCDGHGHFPCEVCGFDIEVQGYDCLACETIGMLPETDQSAATISALASCIQTAFSRQTAAPTVSPEARSAATHSAIAGMLS